MTHSKKPCSPCPLAFLWRRVDILICDQYTVVDLSYPLLSYLSVIILLATSQLGPTPAHGVGILTEMYVPNMKALGPMVLPV